MTWFRKLNYWLNFKKFVVIRRFLMVRHKHSTTEPFISGDSIAKICDYYLFGPFGNQEINHSALNSASSLFVNGDKLTQALSIGIPENVKVLVTGNSDQNWSEKPKLPSSIALWLCQNNGLLDSTSVFSLPIGLENLRLGHAGRSKYRFKLHEDVVLNRVLVPPISNTNPIRAEIRRKTNLRSDIYSVQGESLTIRKYIGLLAQYRFIFCPEGNGYDTHRLWEVLYADAFPVVLETNFTRNLRPLGLPILEIPDVESLTKSEIAEHHSKHKDFKAEDTNVLWTNYWQELIGKYTADRSEIQKCDSQGD